MLGKTPGSALIIPFVLLLFACGQCHKEPRYPEGVLAKMETSRGTILIQLEFEKAPLTVTNFVGLAEGTITNSQRSPGSPFYDGLTFHRVVPGFVVQGGDPLGNGSGDPGYRFPDELNRQLRHDRAGILSMANSGADTNGCQFFITLAPQPHLDGRHTVFGHVIRGLDLLTRISRGDRITRISIIRRGKTASGFLANQAAFDRLLQTALQKRDTQLAAQRRRTLAEIRSRWPKAKTANSGLTYEVLRRGKGTRPENGAPVKAHYVGRLLSGEVFDSSYERNEPIMFTLGKGQVIRGWDEAISDMRRGEKRLLVIPPELGYGSKGAPPLIPANSFLVFEVELIDY